ncbi:MAG: ATP-binding protein, partial [Blastocatellia bacterium]
LKGQLTAGISINFISAGTKGGGCDQVKELVNDLNRHGNHSVYGIIDWDARHSSTEHIIVLGEWRRHSVENYLYDPVLISSLLVREKFVQRAEVGLTDAETYTDISRFDASRLQALSDFVVNKLARRCNNPAANNLVAIEYIGGESVVVPSWYLTMRGHDLEDGLKVVFPELKRYQREPELKREVLNKVIDDLPGLISSDILSILRRIQGVRS